VVGLSKTHFALLEDEVCLNVWSRRRFDTLNLRAFGAPGSAVGALAASSDGGGIAAGSAAARLVLVLCGQRPGVLIGFPQWCPRGDGVTPRHSG
jgi:hypothetical protein